MRTIYDITKTKLGEYLTTAKGYDKINYNSHGIVRLVGISLRRQFADFKGNKCHEDIITIEPKGQGKFNLFIRLNDINTINYFHIPLSDVKSALQNIDVY
jgi:hypothetical protein